jgi:hypothetical protein
MKVKTLSALAGLSGVMIASSANAAFTGVSLVSSDAYFSAHPNAAVAAAWNGGPVNTLDIYRLYANFNSNTAADRVNAVAGIPGSPFTVSVIGGTFYNAVDGHGNHFNLASGVAPTNQAWDTYVTINSLPSSAGVSLSPGFDAATNNMGAGTNLIPSSTNVAWFITPDNTQGQASNNATGQAAPPAGTFRVLLAQFTVTQGALIAGTASLNVNGVDGPIQFSNVPAPGALALLGLAGLVCRRRRA